VTKIKLASGEEIDVGDPALLDPEIREALIAASDTGPIDIKGAADRAMRRAWEDLNAPEKAIVGFRGKTRSIASGALEMLGIAPESVEYFENVERPAIEAGSGDLAGELGAALPNIMGGPARLGPAIAFEAGMESLAAPAGLGGRSAADWRARGSAWPRTSRRTLINGCRAQSRRCARRRARCRIPERSRGTSATRNRFAN
jgi:hypothetical protein